VRVLVVEDSARMAEALRKGLTEESYAVDVASEGLSGLHMASSGEYDLVLLDVNLPGMDGFSLIKTLRERRSDVPVIMVTARDDIEDRIAGLDGGADDYVVKPFSFEELLARVRAVIRRPGARSQPKLKYRDVLLDPAKGQVLQDGEPVSLSSREFSLLHVLISNTNRIMSRSRLYERVWGCDYDGRSNVLEVYVNYLRKKLEKDRAERLIHTVRGRGYVFGDAP